MQFYKVIASVTLLAAMAANSFAQKFVPIAYGNMDHWVVRNIKESAIIGGNTKTIYAIGPSTTIN